MVTGLGRLVRRAALSAVLVTGLAAVPLAGAASARASAGTNDADEGTNDAEEAIATLEVEHISVEVRRADREVFRDARDGQAIREGDTVRTDATGLATIRYTDESYTRLDVDTTFTVVELTDDTGQRSTVGSVQSGQTWNRVEDLAESESFETEGAGATAAVAGTAYVVSCTSIDECTFTGVVHDVALTGSPVDEPVTIDELEQLTVHRGELGGLGTLTLEQFFSDAWVQRNLTIDAFLGFPGPDWFNGMSIVRTGTVAIVGGPPIQVLGISVNRPDVPPQDPPPDPPPSDPPPPGGTTNGYGAADGTNKGGATFGSGDHPVGNCMASAAQDKGTGAKPSPNC